MKHKKTLRNAAILAAGLASCAPQTQAISMPEISMPEWTKKFSMPNPSIPACPENTAKNRVIGLAAGTLVALGIESAKDAYRNNVTKSESRGRLARTKDGFVAFVNPKSYGRKAMEFLRSFASNKNKSAEDLLANPGFFAFLKNNPLLTAVFAGWIAQAGFEGVKFGMSYTKKDVKPAAAVAETPEQKRKREIEALKAPQSNKPLTHHEAPAGRNKQKKDSPFKKHREEGDSSLETPFDFPKRVGPVPPATPPAVPAVPTPKPRKSKTVHLADGTTFEYRTSTSKTGDDIKEAGIWLINGNYFTVTQGVSGMEFTKFTTPGPLDTDHGTWF